MRVMKLLRNFRRNKDDYEGESYEYAPLLQPLFTPLLLVAKLHEEAEEVRAAMDDPEEYGDLLQALYDLGRLNGISKEAMEQARLKKLGEAGDFITDPAVLFRGAIYRQSEVKPEKVPEVKLPIKI